MLEGKHKIHLVGIGGAGMRAIANILISMGFQVSGSDVKVSNITNKFASMGAKIYIGHDASHVKDVEVVVVSTAIPKTNPEVVAAKEQGLLILHRSDIVKYVLDAANGIAVAGAHGKTTTTSMIGQIFTEAAVDPTVIIGGEVDYLQGNSKLGQGEYCIVEADESDGSFLKLNPKIIVVTNIENDHMDYYKTTENLLHAFEQFLNKLPQDGLAVVCGDNKHLKMFSQKVERNFLTYGFNESNDYIAKNIHYEGSLLVYDVYCDNKKECTIALSVPGEHNILNSLGAYIVAKECSIKEEKILGALQKFTGAKRRFENKGRINDIWVVDDYAHHPTEINATLQAAKNMEKHRIVCVFQPHRYTRTQLLLDEYAHAFDNADVLVMTDIYSAGETPINGIDGHTIPRAVTKATGKEVLYVANADDLPEFLVGITKKNDLVITMGAGNINTYGPLFLKRLEEENV